MSLEMFYRCNNVRSCPFRARLFCIEVDEAKEAIQGINHGATAINDAFYSTMKRDEGLKSLDILRDLSKKASETVKKD
ncbi:hypothetical protein SG0102_25470 [Intestinibaculum porci]|uniref:Uncharacterized protein n=1 Tax=Intestinibaculum porci TaxID=2487118 RepID=A0A3G9JRK6_9FIRM|nr:hypothetical protein SG0102_25470 [Intestinibaculum porci]